MGGVFVQEFNFSDEADTDDVIIEPDSWRFFRKTVYIILLNQTQTVFPLRDKEVGWVQSLQPQGTTRVPSVCAGDYVGEAGAGSMVSGIVVAADKRLDLDGNCAVAACASDSVAVFG